MPYGGLKESGFGKEGPVRGRGDDRAEDGRLPLAGWSPWPARSCAGLSASELAARYRRRKVSPVEVDAVLNRIEKVNPHLNAFVTLTAEAAPGGQAGRAR